MSEHRIIRPQDGYQTQVLISEADIAIGGGAAGAGKSFSLLLDAWKPIIHTNQRKGFPAKNYGALIFRKTYPEIMRQGGLWDESLSLFSGHAMPVESKTLWRFPGNNRIGFAHLQHEKDILAYQGAQIPMIGFDELTHFSKKAFFYLLSRNRSTCGIKPFVRATCNPDPDSWVAEFIAWWIDQATGFPIPERAGKVRYFVRDDEAFIWGDSKDEVIKLAPHLFEFAEEKGINPYDMIKSVTFIPGDIYQNKELLRKDPAYLANLMSQDEDTKLRLLQGNWKIRTDSSSLFDFYKIDDSFTNVIDTKRDKHYMIIDHARFGDDLIVIGTWQGWKLLRIDIMYEGDTNDIMKVVHQVRSIYRVPMSQTLIDQDGIGVKDVTGCRIFQGGATPHKVNRKQQYFKNRRTQCYYYAADKLNDNDILINVDNIWLHHEGRVRKINSINIKGTTHEIKKMIKEELRVYKRENVDLEQRKQITPKATVKALLGRSPNFADMIAMRSEMDFIPEKKGLKRN